MWLRNRKISDRQKRTGDREHVSRSDEGNDRWPVLGSDSKGRGRLHRPMLAVLLVLILGLTNLCMSGCGVDDIDISGYADETITISGIAEADVVLTIKDLKEMNCVTRTCESTSDKIGKLRVTGPTLDTVLQVFGMSQKDFSKAHIYAKDEYDAKLGSDVLDTEDIILAFGVGGEPLPEEDAPVRIIIADSDSAYWVRMVERIELE